MNDLSLSDEWDLALSELPEACASWRSGHEKYHAQVRDLVLDLEDLRREMLDRCRSLERERKSLEREREVVRSAGGSVDEEIVLSSITRIENQLAKLEYSRSGDESAPSDEKLRHDLDDALETIQRLRTEREELRAELDLARTRVSELSDQVERLQNDWISRQEQLSEEIHDLKTAWGRGAPEAVTPRKEESQAPPPTPSANATMVGPPNPNGDPVVSSVVAQFAKLQRDVAQRRVKRTPPGK